MSNDDDVLSVNPFAIPDLWKPSALVDFDVFEKSPPLLDLEALDSVDNEDHELASFRELDIQLPSLDNFQFGPLENVNESESSSISAELDTKDDSEDDPWAFAREKHFELEQYEIKSWERFHDEVFREPRTVYTTAAGPRIFDTALEYIETKDEPSNQLEGRAVESSEYIAALQHLGMGRESKLFRYETAEHSFLPLDENVRMSGYTMGTCQQLATAFVVYGNQVRSLQTFIDNTYRSRKSFPTQIALAQTVSEILMVVSIYLGSDPRFLSGVSQLERSFHRPGLILDRLCNTVNIVSIAKSDADVLIRLHDCAQELKESDGWVRDLVLLLFTRTSKPWLDSLSAWLGLHCRSFGIARTHWQSLRTSMATEMGPEKGFEGFDALTKMVGRETSRTILETGEGLHLLQSHIPDHVLSCPESILHLQAPNLELQLRWQEIENVQAQAKRYEKEVLEAIREYGTSGSYSSTLEQEKVQLEESGIDTFGVSEAEIRAQIGASYAKFEKQVDQQCLSFEDDLHRQILRKIACGEDPDHHADESLSLTLSLAPMLSFSPIISAQARLVNQACLRMLINNCSLRTHLSLHRRYHLFGDGIYLSRLREALFDPDLGTTERLEGHVRTGVMGLKLGSRDTWPPASSELKTAIVGIFSESCHPPGKKNDADSNTELPGRLSFAIRDIPEEELRRCMNANSIEALDFLRLQYISESPLDTIITPSCLNKYDAIFKFLLRLIRMIYVTNQLLRSSTSRSCSKHGLDATSQMFRIETHHFISSVYSYCFDIAVDETWYSLEKKLEEIETAIKRDELSAVINEPVSLAGLRKYHEMVLDRIMLKLLMQKQQAQVLKLLEEIFGLILDFVALGNANSTNVSANIKALHLTFRKKTAFFIDACRRMKESEDFETQLRGKPEGTKNLLRNRDSKCAGESVFGKLLLKLEMNGHYSTFAGA